MKYVIGKSQQELKSINASACYNNQLYVSARSTYNAILSEAEEFIRNNAPVQELIICRNNFNSGKGVPYKDDESIYCLTISYIPKGKELFKGSSLRTLYSFKLSNELLYVLRCEGWKWTSYSPGIYYYLDIGGDR